MTKAEARAFIEEAEKLPADQIDKEKVAEAYEVLRRKGRLPSGVSLAEWDPWGLRAYQLAQRVGVFPRTAEITSPESVGLETRGVFDPADYLPPALITRVKSAAKDAGVSAAEVDALLVASAQQIAADTTVDGLGRDQVIAQLEATIADYQAAALAGRRPIGVPDNYVAMRTERVRPQAGSARFGPVIDDVGALPGRGRQVSRGIQPRYFEGDQFSPAGQSPERIAQIQAQLVAAGLLEEGEYWAGFWDAATSDAYKSVLGFANQSGLNADETIRRLQETLPDSIKDARARKKAMETFQAPPFIKPDPATIAQDVKEAFRRRLGRDPTPDDLAEMAGVLGSAYREAYEVEVAAQRAAFDAARRAGETGEPQSVGTFQGVDPIARFQEEFERRYRPELARFESLEDVRMNQANVFASLRNMSALIGSP